MFCRKDLFSGDRSKWLSTVFSRGPRVKHLHSSAECGKRYITRSYVVERAKNLNVLKYYPDRGDMFLEKAVVSDLMRLLKFPSELFVED